MKTHLTRSHYKRKPWKNGHGVTEEIFVFPNDHFLFRLSMAALTKSGPFSSYPEIDRTMVLIEGQPVLINGRELSLMTPFSFSGEQSMHAGIEAPGRDFNLMCRRDEATGRILTGKNEMSLEIGGKFFAVFSVGEITMVNEIELLNYEILLMDKTETGTLMIKGSRFLIVEVSF